MLRRAFLATMLAAAGCRPVRRKALPTPLLPPPDVPTPEPEPIVAPTPEPPAAHKVRVVVYLNATKTRVKVGCWNGVCQYREQAHGPSDRLRSGLLGLTSQAQSGWRVSASEDDHFQIVELKADGRVRLSDCPVAVKIVDGKSIEQISGNELSAAWLTKWFHGDAPKLNSKRHYPMRTSRHIGVHGETWQAYWNHLTQGHGLRDVALRLRAHSLDSLKNIHDDCHYGHVDRSLI